MISIRHAVPEDVPALHAIIEAAYRDPDSVGWTTEARILAGTRTRAELITAQIDRQDSYMLVAEDSRAILGTCHIERFSDHGYFGMFAVTPAAQGHGIGSRLAAAVDEIVRDRWHLPEVRMTVIAQREDLIAWYERLGYRRTGQTEPFPGGDTSTPLIAGLHMVVLTKTLTGHR